MNQIPSNILDLIHNARRHYRYRHSILAFVLSHLENEEGELELEVVQDITRIIYGADILEQQKKKVEYMLSNEEIGE